MRHIQAESSICNSKALRPCLQDLVSVEVLQIPETHAMVGDAVAIADLDNMQMRTTGWPSLDRS